MPNLFDFFNQKSPTVVNPAYGQGTTRNIDPYYQKGVDRYVNDFEVVGPELENYIGSSQSRGSKWVSGITSRSLSIIPKFVGGISSLVEGYSMFTGGETPMSDLMSDLDNYLKELLPVYKTKEYNQGDIYDKLGTAEFWAEDFLDGAAFLVSAIIGSKGLNAITSGTRVAQTAGKGLNKVASIFGKGVDPANVNLVERLGQFGISTLYNSASEAAVEAHDMYRQSAKEIMGMIDPETNTYFTKEKAQDIAAKRARFVFGWNMGALLFTNGMEYKMFVDNPFTIGSKFRKGVLTGEIKNTENVILSGLKSGVKGMFAEGSEELYQTSTQQSAKGQKSIIENFAQGISDVSDFITSNGGALDENARERVESTLLGAILGVGGVKSGISEAREINSYFNTLKQQREGILSKLKLDNAFTPLVSSFLGKNGKIDENKIIELSKSRFEREEIMKAYKEALENNDPVQISYLSNLASSLRMFDYLGSEVFKNTDRAWEAFTEANNNFTLDEKEKAALGNSANEFQDQLDLIKERADDFKKAFIEVEKTFALKENPAQINIAKKLFFQNQAIISANRQLEKNGKPDPQFAKLAQIAQEENENLKNSSFRTQLFKESISQNVSVISKILEDQNLSIEDREKYSYLLEKENYILGNSKANPIFGGAVRRGRALEYYYKKVNNSQVSTRLLENIDKYKNDDITYEQLMNELNDDDFKYLDDSQWDVAKETVKELVKEKGQRKITQDIIDRAFEKAKQTEDPILLNEFTQDQVDEIDMNQGYIGINSRESNVFDPQDASFVKGMFDAKKNNAGLTSINMNARKRQANNKYQDNINADFAEEFIISKTIEADVVLDGFNSDPENFGEIEQLDAASTSLKNILKYEDDLKDFIKNKIESKLQQLADIKEQVEKNSQNRSVKQKQMQKQWEDLTIETLDLMSLLTDDEKELMNKLDNRKPFIEKMILKYHETITKQIKAKQKEAAKIVEEDYNITIDAGINGSGLIEYINQAAGLSLSNNANAIKAYENSALQEFQDFTNDSFQLINDLKNGKKLGITKDEFLQKHLNLFIEGEVLQYAENIIKNFSENELLEFYDRVNTISKAEKIDLTLQQISVLMNAYLSINDESRIGTVIKGIYGSGKTKVISKFLLKLLEISSANTMVVTKYTVANEVATKATNAKFGKTIDVFNAEEITDDVNFILVDEYTLLNMKEIGSILKKVKATNIKRKTENKQVIKILFLGDPAQNKTERPTLIFNIFFNNDYSINFSGTLTLSYRTAISSITQAAGLYRGKYESVTDKTVSTDGVSGVEVILSANKAVSEIKSKIFANKDNQKGKIIITTGENLGLFSDVANVKVLTYQEAQSLEEQEVYIYLPKDLFKDENAYNTAMATAISRSTNYVMMYDASGTFKQSRPDKITDNAKATNEEFAKIKDQFDSYMNDVDVAFDQEKEETKKESVEESVEETEKTNLDDQKDVKELDEDDENVIEIIPEEIKEDEEAIEEYEEKELANDEYVVSYPTGKNLEHPNLTRNVVEGRSVDLVAANKDDKTLIYIVDSENKSIVYGVSDSRDLSGKQKNDPVSIATKKLYDEAKNKILKTIEEYANGNYDVAIRDEFEVGTNNRLIFSYGRTKKFSIKSIVNIVKDRFKNDVIENIDIKIYGNNDKGRGNAKPGFPYLVIKLKGVEPIKIRMTVKPMQRDSSTAAQMREFFQAFKRLKEANPELAFDEKTKQVFMQLANVAELQQGKDFAHQPGRLDKMAEVLAKYYDVETANKMMALPPTEWMIIFRGLFGIVRKRPKLETFTDIWEYSGKDNGKFGQYLLSIINNLKLSNGQTINEFGDEDLKSILKYYILNQSGPWSKTGFFIRDFNKIIENKYSLQLQGGNRNDNQHENRILLKEFRDKVTSTKWKYEENDNTERMIGYENGSFVFIDENGNKSDRATETKFKINKGFVQEQLKRIAKSQKQMIGFQIRAIINGNTRQFLAKPLFPQSINNAGVIRKYINDSMDELRNQIGNLAYSKVVQKLIDKAKNDSVLMHELKGKNLFIEQYRSNIENVEKGKAAEQSMDMRHIGHIDTSIDLNNEIIVEWLFENVVTFEGSPLENQKSDMQSSSSHYDLETLSNIFEGQGIAEYEYSDEEGNIKKGYVTENLPKGTLNIHDGSDFTGKTTIQDSNGSEIEVFNQLDSYIEDIIPAKLALKLKKEVSSEKQTKQKVEPEDDYFNDDVFGTTIEDDNDC